MNAQSRPENPPTASGGHHTGVSTTPEQRARNKQAFQAKYDAMLDIVDFLSSFQLFRQGNSRPGTKDEKLKEAVTQARQRIHP